MFNSTVKMTKAAAAYNTPLGDFIISNSYQLPDTVNPP